MEKSYTRIENALRDGLLSFPITDMDEKGQFNAVTFAEKHGKISKIVCQEQFDLVITNFIEAIRVK